MPEKRHLSFSDPALGAGARVDCNIPRSEVEGVEGREEGFEKKMQIKVMLKKTFCVFWFL